MSGSKQLGLKQRNALERVDINHLTTSHDRLLHIAGYGLIAPSTHNTQPWKMAVKDKTIELYADFTKRIPEADPESRDLFMSQGTLIENILLAADAYGLNPKVEVFPQVQDDLVATITIEDIDTIGNHLKLEQLKAIRDRQNYRGFFKGELDQEQINALARAASTGVASATVFYDIETRSRLAELTATGLRVAYAKPAFREEISSYINHNLSKKRTGLHGYSLRLNTPMSFVIPKVMKRKDIGAKLAALNKKSFDTSSAVVIISSTDTTQGWIDSGRTLEKLMVILTSHNVRSSIYAAAIETAELRPQVATILNKPGQLPQLLLCIGNAPDTLPYSVRKELSEITL